MSRALLLWILAASAVLFWNLSDRYLWQDEAACAVLGERLFEHGRPLGYDGVNLITMDTSQPGETAGVSARSTQAQAAVTYFAERGDFKADTTWIGQPWGSMVLSGLAQELGGESNFALRAPFALFGLLTLLLLVRSVRHRLGTRAAWIAGAFLLGNVYWVLHSRQCRYYSPAAFFQLATFLAYLRWQDGARHGATLFATCATLWFHMDFGSFWPTLLVLGAHAVLLRGRPWGSTLATFAVVAALAAGGAYYYELFGRLKPATLPLGPRAAALLLQFNQYQLPLLLLFLVPFAALRSRRAGRPRDARDLSLAALLLAAQLAWMCAVTPFPFYRYLVVTTPLAAFVAAGLLRAFATERTPTWLLSAVAALLIVTPVLSAPLSVAFPDSRWKESASIVRPEWRALWAQWRGGAPDPNRSVVEFLRERLEPGDEILCNYEDVPLMHYLNHPVRGGLPCFRVDARPQARFFVLRRSGLQAGQLEAFQRAGEQTRWRPLAFDAPDIPWGNNPDPAFHFSRLEPAGSVMIFERP